MTDQQVGYSIGVVERDTGIARDTLRIWERRYGFPEPLRNDRGERSYSEAQLRKLQRIRRLLDQGLRPGKLLKLDETALDELEAGLMPELSQAPSDAVERLLEAARSANADQIEKLLQEQYRQLGMKDFILQTVQPLLKRVGELWAAGRLQIFQEHFLSQQLIRFLNTQIAVLQKQARQPRVLLATLPGEEHTLGLYMLVAMLSCRGITTINLGGEVPMDQIAEAVHQFHADIVGITFSGAYQYSAIRRHLLELRDLLPERVEIWSGGEGVRRLRKLPEGVSKFSSLEQLPV